MDLTQRVAADLLAAMKNREYVLPDDIKALAEFVLAHRLVISPSARLKNISSDEMISEILRSLPVVGIEFTQKAEMK